MGTLISMELWSAGHQPAIANQGTFCQRDREPAFSILHRKDLNLCLTPGTSGYSEKNRGNAFGGSACPRQGELGLTDFSASSKELLEPHT